ncbi:MAG: phosphatase PAP2 family protein [Actinobacteria bacterium]|nr:phosphatase PAP2 family protein [Actinomycetota bacterium]
MYREGVFIHGVEMIEHYQDAVSASWFIFLQNLVSFLGDTEILPILAFFLYIVSRRKITIVVFLIFFMSNIYLLTILKVLFMDPRPFMYSLKVQQLQWKCPAEYGNPSGHSFLVFQFYASLVFDFISRINNNIWLMAVPCTMAILIPQSRMYLGAHSLNQVILGLLLGLCMQVLYRYYLQAKIYELVNLLVLRKTWENLLLLAAANISLLIIALMVY